MIALRQTAALLFQPPIGLHQDFAQAWVTRGFGIDFHQQIIVAFGGCRSRDPAGQHRRFARQIVVLIDHLPDPGVDDFADNRFDDRFLAGKNAIQLTDAQARLAGDISDRGAMQSLCRKTSLRSGNDLRAARLLLLLYFSFRHLLPPAIHHSCQYRRLS